MPVGSTTSLELNKVTLQGKQNPFNPSSPKQDNPYQGKGSYDVATNTYTSPTGDKQSVAPKDIPPGTLIISSSSGTSQVSAPTVALPMSYKEEVNPYTNQPITTTAEKIGQTSSLSLIYSGGLPSAITASTYQASMDIPLNTQSAIDKSKEESYRLYQQQYADQEIAKVYEEQTKDIKYAGGQAYTKITKEAIVYDEHGNKIPIKYTTDVFVQLENKEDFIRRVQAGVLSKEDFIKTYGSDIEKSVVKNIEIDVATGTIKTPEFNLMVGSALKATYEYNLQEKAYKDYMGKPITTTYEPVRLFGLIPITDSYTKTSDLTRQQLGEMAWTAAITGQQKGLIAQTALVSAGQVIADPELQKRALIETGVLLGEYGAGRAFGFASSSYRAYFTAYKPIAEAASISSKISKVEVGAGAVMIGGGVLFTELGAAQMSGAGFSPQDIALYRTRSYGGMAVSGLAFGLGAVGGAKAGASYWSKPSTSALIDVTQARIQNLEVTKMDGLRITEVAGYTKFEGRNVGVRQLTRMEKLQVDFGKVGTKELTPLEYAEHLKQAGKIEFEFVTPKIMKELTGYKESSRYEIPEGFTTNKGESIEIDGRVTQKPTIIINEAIKSNPRVLNDVIAHELTHIQQHEFMGVKTLRKIENKFIPYKMQPTELHANLLGRAGRTYRVNGLALSEIESLKISEDIIGGRRITYKVDESSALVTAKGTQLDYPEGARIYDIAEVGRNELLMSQPEKGISVLQQSGISSDQLGNIAVQKGELGILERVKMQDEQSIKIFRDFSGSYDIVSSSGKAQITARGFEDLRINLKPTQIEFSKTFKPESYVDPYTSRQISLDTLETRSSPGQQQQLLLKEGLTERQSNFLDQASKLDLQRDLQAMQKETQAFTEKVKMQTPQYKSGSLASQLKTFAPSTIVSPIKKSSSIQVVPSKATTFERYRSMTSGLTIPALNQKVNTKTIQVQVQKLVQRTTQVQTTINEVPTYTMPPFFAPPTGTGIGGGGFVLPPGSGSMSGGKYKPPKLGIKLTGKQKNPKIQILPDLLSESFSYMKYGKATPLTQSQVSKRGLIAGFVPTKEQLRRSSK